MKTEFFNYLLPPEKIAQHPLEPRDASKLLVIEKKFPNSSSSGLTRGSRNVPDSLCTFDSKSIKNCGEKINSLTNSATPSQSSGRSDSIFSQTLVSDFQKNSHECIFSEMIFRDIPSLFRAGDLLVINNTRVMPARIQGIIHLQNGKQRDIECLFLRNVSPDVWEMMCFPGERLKVGREIVLENGMTLTIVGETYAGRLVRVPVPHHEWLEILKKYGEIPLPPYIVEKLINSELYQTVYATELGSTASPTAGRHFTPELLAKIRVKGVEISEVTLHIGPGTFKPIYEDTIEDYQIHSEFVTIPAETVEKIRATKKQGGRIIAVGTTSVRSLESFAAGKLQPSFRTNESSKGGEGRSGIQDITTQSEQNIPLGMDPRVKPEDDGHQTGYAGFTDLYIMPGFDFQLVDVMITNFHAPRTSLLVLVAAFMGLENMQAAYQYALDHDFRFLSFGDVMWVEKC